MGPFMLSKTYQQVKEEAERRRAVEIRTMVDGVCRSFFAEPGKPVRFQDGTKYVVDEHGSLRKIKKQEKKK